MGHIVALDAEGHLVYEGLLSSKEIATIDEILNTLKQEIPQIESDLEEAYGKSVLYKYNLGKVLGGLLSKYNISASERRKFWDEIKTFATKENRIRNEGSNAETRSFYGQCYRLSQFDQEIVEKLSWRQWQDILDRVGNREDARIFEWIRNKKEKIREDDWREFEKGLHLYLKGKDTSVFSDNELPLLSFPKIIPTVRKSNQKDVDQKNIKQRAFNSRGSYAGHLMTISLKKHLN